LLHGSRSLASFIEQGFSTVDMFAPVCFQKHQPRRHDERITENQ
jgi:hypothetical protein